MMPLVHEELRRLAQDHPRRERGDHMLQQTVPVHEAYRRLVNGEGVAWESRAHFSVSPSA